MSSASPIEVKVVYCASSRKRRGGTARVSTPANATGLVVLGVINALLGGALYYGTWWQADPELRVRLLMHTEWPDSLSAQVTGELAKMIPEDPNTKAGQGSTTARPTPTTEETSGISARTAMLPAAVIGWEVLSTVAICALLLSAGALIKRSRSGLARGLLVLLGVACVGLFSWRGYADWTKYTDYTPDQLRYNIGIGLALLTVLAALVGRRHRGLTRAAAYTLLLSTIGTAVALYICLDFDAIKRDEVSPTLFTAVGIVFLAQPIWGLILFPVSSRVGR